MIASLSPLASSVVEMEWTAGSPSSDGGHEGYLPKKSTVFNFVSMVTRILAQSRSHKIVIFGKIVKKIIKNCIAPYLLVFQDVIY